MEAYTPTMHIHTAQNFKNCLTIATVTMLTIMLVGGFYVRQIPIWISWLKYLSFIYWGWNLLLKIEFSGRWADAQVGHSSYVADRILGPRVPSPPRSSATRNPPYIHMDPAQPIVRLSLITATPWPWLARKHGIVEQMAYFTWCLLCGRGGRGATQSPFHLVRQTGNHTSWKLAVAIS